MAAADGDRMGGVRSRESNIKTFTGLQISKTTEGVNIYTVAAEAVTFCGIDPLLGHRNRVCLVGRRVVCPIKRGVGEVEIASRPFWSHQL